MHCMVLCVTYVCTCVGGEKWVVGRMCVHGGFEQVEHPIVYLHTIHYIVMVLFCV